MMFCRVAPAFRGGGTYHHRRCVNRRVRGGRGLLNHSAGIKAKEIFMEHLVVTSERVLTMDKGTRL